MAELKSQVSSLSLEIAEKLLKDELSNKEAQVKLVEKMDAEGKKAGDEFRKGIEEVRKAEDIRKAEEARKVPEAI